MWMPWELTRVGGSASWTSCDYPSPPRVSRLSEPHWVRTQGHQATLLGLLSWETRRVFSSHLFHQYVRRKKNAPARPSVWKKEHQVEMIQGNWVPNVKVTSSQQTYSSSCVIWITLRRMAPCDGSWFPTLWSKRSSSCSIETVRTLPHAFLTLHMDVDQAY